MTQATEKQQNVVRSLIRQGKIALSPDALEQLTKEEASHLIGQAGYRNGGFKNSDETDDSSGRGENGFHPASPRSDFNAARLGQSANLAVNGRGIDYFLQHKEEFLRRVVEIYHLLAEAEGAVKAPSPSVAMLTANHTGGEPQ